MLPALLSFRIRALLAVVWIAEQDSDLCIQKAGNRISIICRLYIDLFFMSDPNKAFLAVDRHKCGCF